jgi:hypothetical protein
MKDRRKFFKMSGKGVLGVGMLSFLPFKLFSNSKVSSFATSQKSDFKVKAHPMSVSRGNSLRKGDV